MIIENNDVILVDINDIKSATVEGSCTSCGGGATDFIAQMNNTYYANMSIGNAKVFNSYAKARYTNRKIVAGSVKVYPCRPSDSPPTFGPATIDEVKFDIIKFYDANSGNGPSLDSTLAEALAQALISYYNTGDLKDKAQKAVYKDFPTKIYQSKAFGPILEKWANLRFPVSNYGLQQINKPYLPQLNITAKPYFYFCPQKEKITIKIKQLDGNDKEYCKSGLIIINRKSDFGYRINSIVEVGDLESTSYSNWSNYLSSQSSAYQQGILTRAQAVLNSSLPNTPVTYAPAGTSGSGPVFRFRLNNSRTNLFSIQVAIPIGSGPEFGQNWLYTPITTFAVSPDAIATMYNQYQNYWSSVRAAAEAQRNANNSQITTPSPGVTTPPTPIQIDPTAPVVTPPTNPVNPAITNPVDNTIGDGTFGGDSGSFDGGL